jgi:hypothetical protein
MNRLQEFAHRRLKFFHIGGIGVIFLAFPRAVIPGRTFGGILTVVFL